jgi:hypothetical protein
MRLKERYNSSYENSIQGKTIFNFIKKFKPVSLDIEYEKQPFEKPCLKVVIVTRYPMSLSGKELKIDDTNYDLLSFKMHPCLLSLDDKLAQEFESIYNPEIVSEELLDK